MLSAMLEVLYFRWSVYLFLFAAVLLVGVRVRPAKYCLAVSDQLVSQYGCFGGSEAWRIGSLSCCSGFVGIAVGVVCCWAKSFFVFVLHLRYHVYSRTVCQVGFVAELGDYHSTHLLMSNIVVGSGEVSYCI